MIFPDGTREPLHGHNYKVLIRGDHSSLDADMVIDFLHIKPIVKELCDIFDHKLIIPGQNKFLEISAEGPNTIIRTPDSFFSIPSTDILNLPIKNSSVEVMAEYMCQELINRLKEKYNFQFEKLEFELQETPGQSAIFISKRES